MRVKLEPLLAILNYLNNFDPLYIMQSTTGPNLIWISEYTKENRKSGDCLLYDLDHQRIVSITPSWDLFLRSVQANKDQVFSYFETDLPEFMNRIPHKTWFVDLVKGELV